MPLGIDPRSCGIIRAESQRDSAPKPRVASRELPWEKRVVAANPNGVVVRWRRGALSLGLEIARTLTQGSLADSATLGWRTQSLWDCRTTGLSVVPYGNGRARNLRKALAEILAAWDILVRSRSSVNPEADKLVLSHPAPALVSASHLARSTPLFFRAAKNGVRCFSLVIFLSLAPLPLGVLALTAVVRFNHG